MFGTLFNQQNTSAPQASSPLQPAAQPVIQEETSAVGHLDSRSTAVLMLAEEEAKKANSLLYPAHLIAGLLFDKDILNLLASHNISIIDLKRELDIIPALSTSAPLNSNLTDEAKRIFEKAYVAAQSRGQTLIAPEDILTSLCSTEFSSASMLAKYGLTAENIFTPPAGVTPIPEASSQQLVQTVQPEPAKMNSQIVPTEKNMLHLPYAKNLIQAYKDETDIALMLFSDRLEQLYLALLQKHTSVFILSGEAGSGKTSLIHTLAWEIAHNEAPAQVIPTEVFLFSAGLFLTDYTQLISHLTTHILHAKNNLLLVIDDSDILPRRVLEELLLFFTSFLPLTNTKALFLISGKSEQQSSKNLYPQQIMQLAIQPFTQDEKKDIIAVWQHDYAHILFSKDLVAYLIDSLPSGMSLTAIRQMVEKTIANVLLKKTTEVEVTISSIDFSTIIPTKKAPLPKQPPARQQNISSEPSITMSAPPESKPSTQPVIVPPLEIKTPLPPIQQPGPVTKSLEDIQNSPTVSMRSKQSIFSSDQTQPEQAVSEPTEDNTVKQEVSPMEITPLPETAKPEPTISVNIPPVNILSLDEIAASDTISNAPTLNQPEMTISEPADVSAIPAYPMTPQIEEMQPIATPAASQSAQTQPDKTTYASQTYQELLSQK